MSGPMVAGLEWPPHPTTDPRDRWRLPHAATVAPPRSPTVFSVEPGIYLDGQLGVRIEDLVALDAAEGRVERLTRFPREVIVVGG